MSLHHGWGWQPPQTASHIQIRHIQSVWVHWYAGHRHMVAALPSNTHPTSWLRIWGSGSLVESNDVIESWLRWQPSQTASHIHIRRIQSVWAHWYAAHRHMVAALHSYTHPTWLIFGGSGSLVESNVVNMSWLRWQPPQTASHIHIRHINSIWAHWYAVHWHTVAALQSFTHSNTLIFWGSGSLVESKWCHFVIVEADSLLKLLPPSILDIHKMIEQIIMLSIGIP